MGGGWRGEEGDAGAGLFVAGGISPTAPTAPNRECLRGIGESKWNRTEWNRTSNGLPWLCRCR